MSSLSVQLLNLLYVLLQVPHPLQHLTADVCHSLRRGLVNRGRPFEHLARVLYQLSFVSHHQLAVGVVRLDDGPSRLTALLVQLGFLRVVALLMFLLRRQTGCFASFARSSLPLLGAAQTRLRTTALLLLELVLIASSVCEVGSLHSAV